MLAPKLRSARLISVCPIVQAMVGQSRSLYLTGIGPDSSSLMLVAKKTFFGYISLSLLGAHVLKKFCIGRDLLDGIKKWHIYLHLIEISIILSMCGFSLLFSAY